MCSCVLCVVVHTRDTCRVCSGLTIDYELWLLDDYSWRNEHVNLSDGYNYDSTSIRPRYDHHSTTYVTTIWRYRNSIMIMITIQVDAAEKHLYKLPSQRSKFTYYSYFHVARNIWRHHSSKHGSKHDQVINNNNIKPKKLYIPRTNSLVLLCYCFVLFHVLLHFYDFTF